MFLIFLFACTENINSEEFSSGEIDVLSYNIHGLPSAVTGDDTQARLTQIAPLLDQFDLVGMQEDWIDELYPILLDGSMLPYSDRFDVPYDDDKVYGAGLSFLGKHSIRSSTHIYYESCYGLLDNASDCFASKGLQFLEIQVENMILHVYNTHLEAGNGAEDQEVRTQQIDTIITQINTFSQDHPVILMGDFNLEPDEEEEAVLLDRLREESGLALVCTLLSCPEPNHIDQIYIRSSKSFVFEAFAWERAEYFVDEEGIPLSDHPAIMAKIGWEQVAED